MPCHAIRHTMQCNARQGKTIQYNTIQYNTIQYNTIQYTYNTIQYNTIQYNTMQYNTVQYLPLIKCQLVVCMEESWPRSRVHTIPSAVRSVLTINVKIRPNRPTKLS